ncbi:MAG: hypothetical protein JW800_00645 [Candidatus Omnitrophica bacterium]|nr:hypothetical protein [Candidatus Omnitrophota bacterium]
MENKRPLIYFILIVACLSMTGVSLAAFSKETRHFRIMQFEGTISGAELDEAGRILEAVYADVTSYLGIEGYKSACIEARVCGRDSLRASARRYGSVITFHIEDADPATLRHELTHILIDKYFSNAPLWFHEGVAQYVEYARPADIGKFPKYPGRLSFAKLNNNFQKDDTKEEEDAYLYSYGIISYLIEKYGEDKLKSMFGKSGHFSGRFKKAYGKTLNDFEDEMDKLW